MLRFIGHLNNLRYLLGILHGSRAFIGPYRLEIILTNKCKNQCIYCFYRSPLRKKRIPKEWLKQKLDFDCVKGIIDDAKEMGTKHILLSGGGEPFLYPKVYDVIKYIKKKGLTCTILTNGMHIDRKGIKRLFKLKVDKIWLNISSGNAKDYVKQHPTLNKRTFYRIQNWLSYLKKIKKDKRSNTPYISLVIVISKMNYKSLNNIFDFGEKNVDEIYLRPTSLTNDTKRLLLTKQQVCSTYNQLLEIKKKTRINHNINQFVKQIVHPSYLRGSIGREFFKKIPCYIGWAFVRISANGDVLPCCGSAKRVIGNIYLERFRKIWYSKKYNQFRKESKRIRKNKTLNCICTQEEYGRIPPRCVLYHYNIYVHKFLKPFAYRKILKQEKAKEIFLKLTSFPP